MKKIVSILFGVMLIFVVQLQIVSAQDDPARLLQTLETDTDRFNQSLNSALDKTALNNTKAEDDILNYVRQLEDSVDRLKARVDDDKFAAVQTREVLDRARNINRFMIKHSLDREAETDWVTIRMNLDRLARTQKLRWKW